nr:hypothetical protein [Tanacetum cinerariifolium]
MVSQFSDYRLSDRKAGSNGIFTSFTDEILVQHTKGDEGYFIGYSMSSKAFRVFNKRTKRVEENMHVDLLDNKLIEKGAGPNWLFDIDTLTNSMNYGPFVVARTSSTNFSGTKDATSQDVKKDVSSLRYIALPNWFHEAHLETSTSNAQDACNADAPEINGNSNPTATSKQPSSDTRLISKRVTSPDDTPSLDNILTLSNRGTIDQTLFIRKHIGDFILVQVYVDDIIFGSSNPQFCREFEALMHEKFQLSAMDVRSANTPMDKENPWGKDRSGKDVDLHLYRSMIGSLMYLTTSRPDIIFAVCTCAWHQVTPKECHLHAVKRIFRYLKGHPKLGIWYPKDSPFDLVAY